MKFCKLIFSVFIVFVFGLVFIVLFFGVVDVQLFDVVFDVVLNCMLKVLKFGGFNFVSGELIKVDVVFVLGLFGDVRVVLMMSEYLENEMDN